VTNKSPENAFSRSDGGYGIIVSDRHDFLPLRHFLTKPPDVALADYERVLRQSYNPTHGKLTAFHEATLPGEFIRLVKKKEGKCKWDNGYIRLDSRNPEWEGFVARAAAAILGGAALIVPMVIMAVHRAPNKNLITTAVAVVIVSLGATLLSHASWRDLIGMMAAYAAVLVVFVGVNKD